MRETVAIAIPATAGATRHAHNFLQGRGKFPKEVVTVHSAGDVAADTFDGVPRDTILWRSMSGGLMTSVLVPGDNDTTAVHTREGWD